MKGGGSQPFLPATLPTPALARSNLRLARSEVRAKRDVVDGLKDRADASREELAAAGLDVDTAEDDLLDAAEGSPEAIAADAHHQKACKRADRARSDLEKVAATRKLAKGELHAADKRLAAAREDLEAIREGRKTRK